MVDNRRKLFDEEDSFSLDVAREPAVAVAINSIEGMYDVDDWPGMPLVGPSSPEEAIARIDEAEREIDEDGGMDWGLFKSMLKNRRVASYAI